MRTRAHDTAECEQPQRNGGSQPVAALNERDRKQGESRHEDHSRPRDPVDVGFADDDALPSGVERGLERRDDLALRGRLTFARGSEGQGELQRVVECGRDDRQRGFAVRHCGPLPRHGVVDVAANEDSHAGIGLLRKCVGEEIDGPKGARLPIDGLVRSRGIAPDLRDEEPHEKAEEEAHRR